MKRTTMGKQVKSRRSSNEDANSENARKEPKQWETRLNGRMNKNNKNKEKMRFCKIDESSYNFILIILG